MSGFGSFKDGDMSRYQSGAERGAGAPPNPSSELLVS